MLISANSRDGFRLRQVFLYVASYSISASCFDACAFSLVAWLLPTLAMYSFLPTCEYAWCVVSRSTQNQPMS